ncbi:MAG TPA: 4Fe-4S binding protein [Spirochaetia bacterium]
MSRGRPVFDRERCKGCTLCIAACPEKILTMSRDEFNSQGVPFALCFDEARCTGCMSCAIMCPDMVIRIYRLPSEPTNLQGTAADGAHATGATNPRGTVAGA